MDTDQHGSKENLQRPPVPIHSLRDKRPNAAIERPRGPASIRAGVHGSPWGFRLSGKLQQYATSARHAESVNSSTEPRSVQRLSSSHESHAKARSSRRALRCRTFAPSRETAKVFNSQRPARSRHIHCGMSPQPRPAGSTRDLRLVPRAPPSDTMPRRPALRHRRTPLDRNDTRHRAAPMTPTIFRDRIAAPRE